MLKYQLSSVLFNLGIGYHCCNHFWIDLWDIIGKCPLCYWIQSLLLLYSPLTAFLSSLTIRLSVTINRRTINLLIEFSKVCCSIKSIKENVSTRNKQLVGVTEESLFRSLTGYLWVMMTCSIGSVVASVWTLYTLTHLNSKSSLSTYFKTKISQLTSLMWKNMAELSVRHHHIYTGTSLTFDPLSQGYLSSVLWLVSLLAFFLHTEDSSVYERDKERRCAGNEKWVYAVEDRQ